jgi:CRISPR-associated protein Csb2
MMQSISLVIEYLTGYAVATDAGSREKPEWPPHPARVFMALAAAHFETDGNAEQKSIERDALEWLATLSPPDLVVPNHTARDVLTVYVPVNDQSGGEALVKRSRQPRLFPRVHVGDEPVRVIWRVDPSAFPQHIGAIENLCRYVTRIGHSSSLVWVRLERTAGAVQPTHMHDEHGMDVRFRVVGAGAVTRLEQAYNKANIDAFAEIEGRIATAKPKEKKQLRTEIDKQFPLGRPTSQRPVISIRGGYRVHSPLPADAVPSVFDPNFIVLREADENEQTFGLESTALVVNALRDTIMKKSLIQPVPAWVSGHEATGEKLSSGRHMAIFPLAFVGRPGFSVEKNARGHLMGLGILLPHDLSRRDASKVLSPILFDNDKNEPRTLPLTLGAAGVWKIVRDADLSPKLNLRTTTYTTASRSWASITPIVLDRMPKSDRVKDPVAWRVEVAGIIASSCTNVGLPAPVSVQVEKTPFFIGSLRAMPGQGGFPQLRKGRFQVHAAIEFDSDIAGPVLIGAGRFRGYGLMRPWQQGEM